MSTEPANDDVKNVTRSDNLIRRDRIRKKKNKPPDIWIFSTEACVVLISFS